MTPTMVDLFCGAGIGAYGFKEHMNIIWAIDNNPYAVNTYNLNIKNVAETVDIRTVEHFPYADVYVATPPCTSFSTAGKMDGQYSLETGDLFDQTLRAIAYAKPRAVIIENVPGLVSKTHRPFFDYVLKQLDLLGYNVVWDVLDCKYYGVAQSRKRMFLVALKKGELHTYKLPLPTTHYPRPLVEAIGDLPEPNGVNNHVGHGLRNDEIPYVDLIPPGGNWKNLPVEAQKAFMKGAFESGGGKTGFLRKVSFNKPAHTVTATMMGKNNAQIVDPKDKYGDPDIESPCRRFTVRECLRLQGVGDDFYFPEEFNGKPVNINRMYERCSGIPAPMAKTLALTLRSALFRVGHNAN